MSSVSTIAMSSLRASIRSATRRKALARSATGSALHSSKPVNGRAHGLLG